MGCCSSTSGSTPVKFEDAFKGMIVKGRIHSIYDGDTFRCETILFNKSMIINIRCSGYDSPEMKPPLSNPNRQQEIQAAVAAKNALSDLIHRENKGGEVWIKILGFEKYGRFLCDVYTCPETTGCCTGGTSLTGIYINQWMIKNKHGRPYEGGTKIGFSEG